ncbi:hypothetical protein ACOME3_001980 [Neoechinorhynchus agilis]
MDFPRGVDVLHGRGHLKRKSSLKQLRIQKRLKFQVDDVIRPSLLTVRDFTKDCLCLASIMRIYKNRLRLSLPHHQFAYAYVQEATSLFRVGQYVSCAISKPAKGNRRTKWHQVSIFPRDVNRFVGRVQPGTVFSGVVTALEDHGFTVDLGINEYVGFINKKRSIKEFGRLLSIGSYVLGVTTNVVGRVVTLQSPSVALNATLNGEDGVFVQSITPGSRLHLNRNEFKTLKDGLYYSRDGLNVFVNRLDMPDFTSEIPDEGTIVTVVYVNESTKTIYASLLHSHFLLQSSTFNDDHSKWKRGVFISKSVVEHLKKAYCILKTRDGTRCYLRINNTDTKQKNNVDRMADLMKVGDCKQCRVIDVNGFEGFLIVSTIPRDLNRNEPFSIGDLKVGQKVNVKSIKSQGKNGWTVGISRSVTGFVPKAHTNADALKQPFPNSG